MPTREGLDDTSDDEIIPRATGRGDKAEDDPSLNDFVKVTVPDDESEGREDEKTFLAKSKKGDAKESESESESETKPSPDYTETPDPEKGRSGEMKRKEVERRGVVMLAEDAPLHDEPESNPKSKNDQEPDFRIRMPGSYDASEPSLSTQGQLQQQQQVHRFPRGPSVGWIDLFKRLQTQLAGRES
jgi:hypothetical protein